MLEFCGSTGCINTPPSLTKAKDKFAMANHHNVTKLIDKKACDECGSIFVLRSPRYRAKFNKQRYCSRVCTARAAVRARDPENRVEPMEVGSTWGRLTIVGTAKRGNWHCRCACGALLIVDGRSLRCGNTRSCGCLRSETSRENGKRHATHGMTKSREYAIWRGMRERCRNPKNGNYPHYGGRGIGVCDRWFDSFEAFYADMGPRPSPLHSIDRLDVNGDYERANCRWADLETQANNKSNNHFVLYRGFRVTLAEAARASGVPASTLWGKLRRKVRVEGIADCGSGDEV